jgi:hypothetical protein
VRRFWPAESRETTTSREPPGDTEPLHRRVDLVAGRAHRRTPERHVLGDGQIGVEPVAVAEHAHPRSDRVAMGHEIESEHPTAPALDRQQSGAQPEHARLPGAVGAAEEDHLATLHLERGAGEHGEAAEHRHRVTQVDGIDLPTRGTGGSSSARSARC